MLTVEEIQYFINDDRQDKRKRAAAVGQNYYEAEHDIKNYRLFYYNADGVLTEDKTRSNIKISHAFFTELVDQEVQYLLSGKDDFIKSDIPELQAELDTYFNNNDDFRSELNDLLTGAIAKGFEYMYMYRDNNDKIAFQCADSLNVIEVRAENASDKQRHIIYWFIDQTRILKDNKKIRKIQVWDDQQVYFYRQEDDKKIEEDEDQKINPRPHVIYTKFNDNNIYYENFGYIPFFRLDNNKKQYSSLKNIKTLIDDYDLMSCGLSNNIQDASEYIVVVKDYQGDNLDELIQNIKTKKHIGVDENGDVEYKTVEIPYQARQAKLDLDEKNIYRFGMGLNLSSLKDTAATTNIAIKASYSLLDLKTNKLEIRVKQFLRKIIDVILQEINKTNETDYQLKNVCFEFNREMPTNEQENAQIELTEAQTKQTEVTTILNIASMIDNETTLKEICDILDIDFEEIKSKLPENAADEIATAEAALNSATVKEGDQLE